MISDSSNSEGFGGTEPDGSESWGVATVGPNVAVGAGVQVPASAMIYDSSEVQS